MGLDAVVYRNEAHLNLGADEKDALVEPQTGEVYFESDALARKHADQRRAVARRIGNIAEVSALREEVGRLTGPGGFVVTKVLYSETHSGDTVPLKSLPALSAELVLLRDSSGQSTELVRFLNSLEELVRVAEAERNPIVFV